MSEWPANPPKSTSQQWELAQQAKARAPEPPAKKMEGTSGEFNRAHDNQQKPTVTHLKTPMPHERTAGSFPQPGGMDYKPNNGLRQHVDGMAGKEALGKEDQAARARSLNVSLQKAGNSPTKTLGLEDERDNNRDDRAK